MNLCLALFVCQSERSSRQVQNHGSTASVYLAGQPVCVGGVVWCGVGGV